MSFSCQFLLGKTSEQKFVPVTCYIQISQATCTFCTLIYRLLNFYPCRIFFSSSHISISLAQNSKNRWPVKSIDHNSEGSCIASTCQAFKDDAALSLVSLEYICTSPKTSLKITREKKIWNRWSIFDFILNYDWME